MQGNIKVPDYATSGRKAEDIPIGTMFVAVPPEETEGDYSPEVFIKVTAGTERYSPKFVQFQDGVDPQVVDFPKGNEFTAYREVETFSLEVEELTDGD